MDAHFFRILAAELLSFLEGARVEKIHAPFPDVLVFTVFAAGHKLRLFFRFERKSPMLFFSREKLPNPKHPPALVMRLRKYCANRRLGPGFADYSSRRLYFSIPAGADDTVFLLLDMTQGAFVLHKAPVGCLAHPPWPGRELVDSLSHTQWKRGENTGPWQDFAVLTPLLRESLADMPCEESRALVVDLEAGGGDVFLYGDAQGRPLLPCAWPLPQAQCRRRGLGPEPVHVFTKHDEAVFLPLVEAASEAAVFFPAHPALTAACLAWEASFFAERAGLTQKEMEKPLRKASKKQEKLLAKLAKEEERLKAMLALREDAIALQAELWRYGPEEKRESVLLPHGQEERILTLNPLLTVRQNMARLFKESARGTRGLSMLAERRAALLANAPALHDKTLLHTTAGSADSNGAENSPQPPSGSAPAANFSGPRLVVLQGGDIPGVARFVSSDGFVLLRGKNAKGNQRLLKIGSAHDLWLHAETGPSAHVIVRRSHGAEEVPEQSLLEAGALVAAKSRFKDDSAVDVMVALLRHVHPIKGGAPGTVRVDQVLRTFRVAPHHENDDPNNA